jgi:thioredoxin:protein disulfide reductase
MQAFQKNFLFLFFYIFCMSSFAQTLDAKNIFQLKITSSSEHVILHWDIQPGYFLYKERIKISNSPSISWPPSLKHQDRMGITHDIYRQQLELKIPLPKNMQIKVTYQGCSDSGICFPPQIKKQALAPATHQSFIWTLLSFLGLGALMAFTPCVLPMLPVMTKVVLGNHQHSKKQLWGLASCYVLGMSLSYAIVGAILSQIGKNLFMLMQRPVIILSMAIVYTYFGFASLEWIKIKLPQRLQNRSLKLRSHLQSGHYGSAALMGSLSLLVLSPCVTAPLLGALAFITQMGDVWKGTLALFTLGIGMGLPLMLFAVSAGHLLPKAGAWMENIKIILAILLFSVAAILISRILAFPHHYLPWVAVFLMSAYLIRPQEHTGASKHFRTLMMLGLMAECLMLCYGMIRPSYLPWPFQQSLNIEQPKHMHHSNNIHKAIESSKKPVLLYFTARWCATCQHLEKSVWTNQSLLPLFQNYRIIKVDLTKNRPEDLKVMRQFDVIAPPTIINMSRNQDRLSGEEITIEHLQNWIH